MTRIISAVVLGAVVLAVLLVAPALFSLVLVTAIVLIALKELSSVLLKAGMGFSYPAAVLGAVCVLAGAWLGKDIGLATGVMAAIFIMTVNPVIHGEFRGASRQIAGGLLGVIMIAWTLAHALLYFPLSHGRVALLYPLVVVWICDTSAFYFGSTFGKRKLAPKISPNKSVEGFTAGLVSSLLVALSFKYFSPMEWDLPFLMISGLILSLVGQLGDLVESLIKRDAGVKDSGVLIPGHGGILDRIDSIIFALPVFYHLIRWFG